MFTIIIIPQTKNLVNFWLFFLSSGRLLFVINLDLFVIRLFLFVGLLSSVLRRFNFQQRHYIWDTVMTNWMMVNCRFYLCQMYDSRDFTTSRRLYDTSVDFVCLVTTLWHVCQMIQTLGRFQICNWDLEILYCRLFFHTCSPEQSCQVNFTADDYQIVFNNRKRQASELHNDFELSLSALNIR